MSRSSVRLVTLPYGFDGVDLKLRRAEHHLQKIQRTVAKFDHGPNVIPGEFDSQTGTYVFRAKHDAPPPDALSAVLGEFLYNVRCALDYIVYELISGENIWVDFRKCFPIYTDPVDYAKGAPAKIKGVPSQAVAVFERLQPFYGANSDPSNPNWRDPNLEPLAVLHRLNNMDKHKTLALTEGIATARLVFPDNTDVRSRPAKYRTGPFKRGAILAVFTPDPVDPDIKVNLAVSFHVRIQESRQFPTDEIVQTLDQILRVVRSRVVPAFVPFFPARS